VVRVKYDRKSVRAGWHGGWDFVSLLILAAAPRRSCRRERAAESVCFLDACERMQQRE
jgi:hypothetical protein